MQLIIALTSILALWPRDQLSWLLSPGRQSSSRCEGAVGSCDARNILVLFTSVSASSRRHNSLSRLAVLTVLSWFANPGGECRSPRLPHSVNLKGLLPPQNW
jgi:hypothetical protein